MKKLFVVLLLLCMGAFVQADLIGHYKFNDTLDNELGTANGTFSDGTPTYEDGAAGNAITLDGENDHVVLGTASDYNFGADIDFSVALWVKTDGWSEDAAVFSNKNWNSGGNTGWAICGGTASGGVTWQWNYSEAGAGRKDYDPSTPILNDGLWHHLCATHDRDGMATFYFDGVEQNQIDISATGTIDAGFPTVIGTDGEEGATWAYWFAGAVDDVKIFNHVLTATEVTDAMATDAAKNPSPANAEEFVQLDAQLSWEAGELPPTGYDVYFGTDPNVQNNEMVISDQLVTTYDPDLDWDTTYYWSVDVRDSSTSNVITGATWSFTTTPQIPVVSQDPVDSTVPAGDSAAFTVDGLNIDNYEWYKEGSATILSDTDTLIVENVQLSDEGYYYCTIENNATPDVVSTVSARLLTERLIGHWPFDGNADDMTGNANGVIHGDPQWVEGIVGSGAIDLTPSTDPNLNDHVVLGTADDIAYRTTDFTVALWVKTAGGTSDPAIISNKDWNSGGNTGWFIGRGGSNWQWNFASGGVRRDYDPDLLMEDDQWHHICVAHDRDGVAAMYYDGLKTGEVDISAAAGNSLDDGYPTVVGTDGAQGEFWAAWFDGTVDDVKILSYALDGYEVAHLYADTMTTVDICVDQTGLEFDVSGPDDVPDCIVNLYDFAKFAATWLNCNRVVGADSELLGCK